MDKQVTYCTNCQKDVHFVITPAHPQHAHACIPDGDQVVCLNFGEKCEGDRCPLSGLPTKAMGIRLARTDEARDPPWSLIHGVCEECDFPTEFKVLDDETGCCTVCGSINRLTLLKLDDGSYVVATSKEA